VLQSLFIVGNGVLLVTKRDKRGETLSRALAQQQNAGRALATVERDEAEEKGRLRTWFSERIHDLFDLSRAH
jgi:hypothetical protein